MCLTLNNGHKHFTRPSLKRSKTLEKLFKDLNHKLFISWTGQVEVQEGEEIVDVILKAAKAEISLTLTNKYEVPEDDDSDMKALFVRLVSFSLGCWALPGRGR